MDMFLSKSKDQMLFVLFGETELFKKNVLKNTYSRKACLSYLLNLSSRKFQDVNFLLALYDMTVCHEVANLPFVRSKLPAKA